MGNNHRFAWLTIDEPGVTTCQALSIPKNFVQHMRGALAELCEESNWQQAGTMTAQECADAMWMMWQGIGACAMIGSISFFATQVLPDGWLPCDGSTHDRIDYPDLYAVLHEALIVDADHFMTPNLKDRVLVAPGDVYIPDDMFGERTHTLTIAEMPVHDHTIPNGSTFPYGEIPEVTVTGGVLLSATGTAGGGAAHNNEQPSACWMCGIKAR